MTSPSLSCPKSCPTIQLLYGAWHQDQVISLPVPATWVVQRLDPQDASALSPDQLEAAIQVPIGTQTIHEIAKRKRSAVIVVEDITRPSRVDLILPGIIRELKAGGLSEEKMSILFAGGAHRPMTQDEIDRKLPSSIRGCIKVHIHDFMGDGIDFVGWIGAGPVYLNRIFLQADMRICIGTVMPHNETGFGGGAKLVIPGVAGRKTIAFLHGALRPRLRGIIDSQGGVPDRRSWLEAVVSRVGVDIVVCSAINAKRQVAGLFVGDLVEAHRAAAKHALAIGRTQVNPDTVAKANAVLVNAYPLDTDPIQMGKAISTSKELGAKNTVVVNAASDGTFYHGMGMGSGLQLARLARNLLTSPSRLPDITHFLRGACRVKCPSLLARYAYFSLNHLSYRDFLRSPRGQRVDWSQKYSGSPDGVFVYSPRFPTWGFKQRYARGNLFRNWDRLCAALTDRVAKESLKLLVLPCAPLQIPYFLNDQCT